MIPMTPAHERYTTFSCPNPDGQQCNRPNAGNLGHRSWTGKHQPIARLRCTACDREFSERVGTLMAVICQIGVPRLTHSFAAN